MSALVGTAGRASLGTRLGKLTRTSEAGLLAIVILISLAAAISLPAFRTGQNITETLNNAATVVVVAIGEALVLLTRQIDLSVGATLGLAAFGTGAAVGHVGLAGPFGALLGVIGQLSVLGPAGVILVALLIGALMGLGNALLVDFVRMPAIIATLATLSIYSGLQVSISGGNQIYSSQLPPWLAQLYVSSFLGIQSFIWIAAICVVLFSLIMRMTRWGRDLYVMGSNPEAARTIAVPIRRRTYEAFIVCGALAGLGGLLYAAQYGNVDATAGVGFNLTVIAAAVVGGVSLFGGSGTPIGAALGALLLGEIGDVLQLLKISIFAQETLQGAAIVGAVVVYALLTRRLQRPAARAQYIEHAPKIESEGSTA
ncbi:MAG: ABC transporter permease [Chloroflexota bacterium]